MQQSQEDRPADAASHATRAKHDLRIAYLVNLYPKVSHTFIRREIQAAERVGFTVDRIAIRGWDAELADADDVAEQGRVQYVLKGGVLPLMAATLRISVREPRAFFRALGEALRMSFRAARPLPYHLVYLAEACRMKELLAERPVAHLHAHFGTNPAEVALLLRLLGGPPYSFTVHGPDEFDEAKYLHLDRKTRHAKFVAVISSYTRSQLMRHVVPEDWHKIRVVHCGLDDASFASVDAPDEATAPVFLCIGRLSGDKGHLVLLEAFSRIVADHPDARLVLVGDGPLRPVIERRIRDLGLQSQVRITGWISSAAVRGEILRCRVLVQPSFQEGLPVVIMEAMALRRPVISTYIAGIPELIVPGEVGWLIPAGDADALAGVMEESIRLPAHTLERMGRAARQRVAARHSIDREMEKLAALIADKP